MRFAAFEGSSREWADPVHGGGFASAGRVYVEDVEAEATRRLDAIRLDEWRTREFVTGNPMPDWVQQAATQIEFAARAIARLAPIPADYCSDVYWPRVWEQD